MASSVGSIDLLGLAVSERGGVSAFSIVRCESARVRCNLFFGESAHRDRWNGPSISPQGPVDVALEFLDQALETASTLAFVLCHIVGLSRGDARAWSAQDCGRILDRAKRSTPPALAWCYQRQ